MIDAELARDELTHLADEYDKQWARATLDTIAFETLPRAMSDATWSSVRKIFTSNLWSSEHDGLPVLLAHLIGSFRLNNRENQLQVLLTFYDDGAVETHYYESLSAYYEVATAPRPMAEVVGGSVDRHACSLVVSEPAFGFTHTVSAKRGTVAADVARVLAHRARPDQFAEEGLPPTGRPTRPAPRLVRDAREAEELAAEWVRAMGFRDARTTPPGADGGLDIHSPGTGVVVGQVKFEAVKTGRHTLQALYGAGHAAGAKQFVFFSSAGYTSVAVSWADAVGMALFRFALDGTVEAANGAGEDMLATVD